MDTQRFSRWLAVSHSVGGTVQPFMLPLIQNLGRMDCQLIEGDARFLSLPLEQRGTVDESMLLTERVTLSYLWVLGAYEFTRTLHQLLAGHDLSHTVQMVKQNINRIRVPLAKMEAATRSPTDSPIAYPALNEALGIAWQISKSEFITRHELADQLLTCLEAYAAHRRD